MAYTFINGMPGIGTLLTATPNNILRSLDGLKFSSGGAVLDKDACGDPSNSPNPQILTSGLAVGKQTSGGRYAPTIVGVLQSNATSGATSLTVSAAQATEIARRVGSSGTGTLKVFGSPDTSAAVATQALTFSAVNTSTGVITVSATSAAYALGSYITAADGSEVPLGILLAEHAIRMTDFSGTRVHQPLPTLLISADLWATALPDYSLLAPLTKAYLKAQLNLQGRTFTYSDDY